LEVARKKAFDIFHILVVVVKKALQTLVACVYAAGE